MEKIVTVKELASLLKLTETTIYKLAWSKQLPGFKIGDSWRFEKGDISRLIRRKANGKEIQSTDKYSED